MCAQCSREHRARKGVDSGKPSRLGEFGPLTAAPGVHLSYHTCQYWCCNNQENSISNQSTHVRALAEIINTCIYGKSHKEEQVLRMLCKQRDGKRVRYGSVTVRDVSRE